MAVVAPCRVATRLRSSCPRPPRLLRQFYFRDAFSTKDGIDRPYDPPVLKSFKIMRARS